MIIQQFDNLDHKSLKNLRQIISLGALLVALAHMIFPNLAIDAITLSLILIAILPWLASLIKSLELPGGWKLEFAEVSKKIIQEKLHGNLELARHQIVASDVWDTGYYKLYSNGVLVEKYRAKILANQNRQQITFPCAFPNEPINIQIIGDIEARVVEMSQGYCVLIFKPSDIDRDIELRISGI